MCLVKAPENKENIKRGTVSVKNLTLSNDTSNIDVEIKNQEDKNYSHHHNNN